MSLEVGFFLFFLFLLRPLKLKCMIFHFPMTSYSLPWHTLKLSTFIFHLGHPLIYISLLYSHKIGLIMYVQWSTSHFLFHIMTICSTHPFRSFLAVSTTSFTMLRWIDIIFFPYSIYLWIIAWLSISERHFSPSENVAEGCRIHNLVHLFNKINIIIYKYIYLRT